jgi:hypothetical protein
MEGSILGAQRKPLLETTTIEMCHEPSLGPVNFIRGFNLHSCYTPPRVG